MKYVYSVDMIEQDFRKEKINIPAKAERWRGMLRELVNGRLSIGLGRLR